MSGRYFFDTNILIYLFDESTPDKKIACENLFKSVLGNNDLYISVQVLNEFIWNVTRKIEKTISLINAKRIAERLEKYIIITQLSQELSMTAIDISIEYDYSFWDSLILAAALEKNCGTVFSEDMQSGRIIQGRLRIQNPFDPGVTTP